MLRYKRESRIPDITTDKKLNAIADVAIDADKRQDTMIDKKLYATVDETVDANRKWDITANKKLNIALTKLLTLTKNKTV